MKYFIPLLFALWSTQPSLAKDTKYPVSEIAPHLMQNVDVVVREDHMKFTIHEKNRATWRVRIVATILNENGKRYAEEVVGYDKLSKITQFQGASYDANGALIRKLKSSEIYDQSAFDGFSLYSDNRLKAANLTYGQYPYTVEFEYEVEFKFLFYIPGFYVVSGERVSVENGSYVLEFKPDLRPKFKTLNLDAKPEETKLKDGKTALSWSFKDIKPVVFDPLGPNQQELVPQIIASPSTFEFGGYEGKSDSWEEFGQWIISLNKGRDVLPEDVKLKVKELTANLKTPEEKIKAVYEYMQNKTRYVSIQMGIGGYQPFEASVVEKTGYGDCKALSNYMVSLLQSVGIKSNYVLINAGRNNSKMREDFPSTQFNHAVVMVPNERDTLWLECTSQTNPFAYMGTFTGDRRALAITETGAKVVSTPKYPAEVNVQTRTANVEIQPDGNGKATVTTRYSGLQYESDGLSFILDNQFDEQKKWVERNTEIPSFNINTFKMANYKNRNPTAVVTLDLQLNRYASANGKRLFLPANLMNKTTFIPPKADDRKTDMVIKMGFVDMDTIIYQVPESLYPEGVPEPISIESKFGKYEASFKLDQGKVVYTRRLKIKEGTYPKESYNDYIEFRKKINKADNTKVVFVGKT